MNWFAQLIASGRVPRLAARLTVRDDEPRHGERGVSALAHLHTTEPVDDSRHGERGESEVPHPTIST